MLIRTPSRWSRDSSGHSETEWPSRLPRGEGPEFHLTLRPVKKIKHLRMQIAAKRDKFYANLQPAATRLSTLILVLVGLMKMHRP